MGGPAVGAGAEAFDGGPSDRGVGGFVVEPDLQEHRGEQDGPADGTAIQAPVVAVGP